ncbi:hypothetical protein, conserved [Babesia bigemina]|uniref:CERLI1-like PH domain-containing protein n=1 Tax=Babesia bigemina TaxID=5866 RepID=A0A061D9M3_BABBI|nr:hypothetical protein, conserved [Babesia bigemina]CDR97233.1 hypothetical protein, conserved [Babesia bigemina]|eukprot:XP_012769419.1 hypothetical protein, conserved [Babesia bigemina]
MFFIDPQTVGCCAIGCCGVAAASYVSNNLAKIPHPSECGCIGSLYRITGLHSHDSFDFILEIHEAVGGVGSGNYFFEVEAGRMKYRTQTLPAKDGQLQVHEKLKVHVRQCDDTVVVNLYRSQLLRSDQCGELKFSVEQDLMAPKPAKRRWFTMVHQNRTATRVKVSIYCMSDEMASRNLSALTLQAIVESQQDGSNLEEELVEELENMDDYAKLRFYSKVLSGPLKKMNTFGQKWTTYYFKPLEISAGNWEWCVWNSIEDYNAGLEAIEAYPFLAMSVVLADPTNAACFYVKYHKDGNDFGILLKRIDRNRDLWSDSLYEFIEKTREVYFRTPNKERIKISHKKIKRCKDLEVFCQQSTDDEKRTELKAKLALSKRLTSPMERAEANEETKLPDAIAKMALNMYVEECNAGDA